MATIDDLLAEGHNEMRLPTWNPHAYIKPDVLDDGRIGPWTSLYDVANGVGGGEPIRILTLECDRIDAWEPVVGQEKVRADERD